MAGAPLGTRTAAKQSESKSKLMPNLFESRGLRRFWASHGQPGSYRFGGRVSTDKRACVHQWSSTRIVGYTEIIAGRAPSECGKVGSFLLNIC
jgi:hypothetical protein